MNGRKWKDNVPNNVPICVHIYMTVLILLIILSAHEKIGVICGDRNSSIHKIDGLRRCFLTRLLQSSKIFLFKRNIWVEQTRSGKNKNKFGRHRAHGQTYKFSLNL